jgi:YD repeat-containing protein
MKKVLFLLLILLINFNINAAEYIYNDSRKLKQVTYDNGTVVSYEYDADGNITSVTPTGTSSGGDTGGGDTGGGDTGGGTTPDPTPAPTPSPTEPAKKESSGGALGMFLSFFSVSLLALRLRLKVKNNKHF